MSTAAGTTAVAAPARTRRSVVLGLLRDAARLDRTQSDPLVSARNAVGVAAPLAIGVLAGNIAIGLTGTIGALLTAFADRPGPYRLRLLRMCGTALAAGTTSGLAVLASRSAVASVLLLLVLSFGAGLLLAGGQSAAQTGIAGVGAAVVIGHLTQPASAALHVGLLVAAGGAGQALLAVLGWPLRRHRPERLALAALYRQLAAAARTPAGTGEAPPASAALTEVRQTLYGLGHDHGPSVEAFRVLLDEGERIRRELLVLTSLAERLGAEHEVILGGLVRGSLTATAEVLDAVAAALERGRSVDPASIEAARTVLHRTSDRLDSGAEQSWLTRRAAAARLRSLSGQLRAVVRSAATGAAEGRDAGPRETVPLSALVLRPLSVLRANLARDSTVFWHAVRVSVAIAGTDAVVRAANLDRGYWVSLTVLVVLRPDFGATLQRAVMRTVGTVAGVFAGTELLRVLPHSEWWLVGLIGVFAFAMRVAGPGNVALSAVGLSALVVVLLEISGVPAHTTEISRALATVAGGAIAVLASLALPAWERNYLPGRLAVLVGAYRELLEAISRGPVVRPDGSRDASALHRARAATRVARTNATAAVDRAVAEPVAARAEIELGRAVLVHTHRFVQALLSLDSAMPTVRRAADGVPAELADFLSAASATLGRAADALVSRTPPETERQLRPAQERLAAAVLERPALAGDIGTAATVADATDRMTNSMDTLLAELRRQLTSRPPTAEATAEVTADDAGDAGDAAAAGRVDSGPEGRVSAR